MGFRLWEGRHLEKEVRSKGRNTARSQPLLSNALKPRTVGAVEYYGAQISPFCDLQTNLPVALVVSGIPTGRRLLTEDQLMMLRGS